MWTSADKLHDNRDAAEYKHLVVEINKHAVNSMTFKK